MKRTITTIITMLSLTGLASAQQISNSGFELWDTIGDYTQPKNWYTLNALSAFGVDPTTTLTDEAHSGSYAVRLESKVFQDNGFTGLLCTGPILDDEFNPTFDRMKVAFAFKPKSLKVYYKAFPMANDSGILSMCLTKWNAALQQTDTVAEATMVFSQTVSTYTLANIPFEYLQDITPDSMFIIATSSADGFNPTEGSMLIFDDLELDYTTGLNDVVSSTAVKMYPNPTATILNIEADKMENSTILIADYSGRIVYTQNHSKPIDVSALANGIYFVSLQNATGNVYNQKLIIQH
jgi:hypothetical protein